MTDATFERARAAFVEGLRHFEAGRYVDAERAYEASLALLPGRVSTLTNLAATKLRLGRAHDALQLLDDALAAQPDDPDAAWQRAQALADLGRHADALQALERVIGARPDAALPWFRHGLALQRLGRHDEALGSYGRALALDPALAQAWSNRGGILKEQGRLDEAAACFERALALGADPELHRYLLAGLRRGAAGAQAADASAPGAATPARAPVPYVQQLFDGYAARFDDHLERVLRYEAHVALARLLRVHGPARHTRALDLGCGTGLCGRELAPLVDAIDGVDLSAGMLGQARARQVYAELTQADVAEHLQRTDRRYDLVTSTDVFIYIGDLDPVFAGVQRVLEPGGTFAFSVEAADERVDYELRTSLRYAHSRRYLRDLAARRGLEPLRFEPAVIREDQGRAIDGWIVLMRRPAADTPPPSDPSPPTTPP